MSVSPALPAEPQRIEAPRAASAVKPDNELSPAKLLKLGERVAKSLKKFVELNPAQLYEKDQNKCLRFESWQFAGICMGCTAMVTATEEVKNEAGETYGFAAHCAVSRHGMVVSGGSARCTRLEDFWIKAPDFQILSMAQTRCCVKGLRLTISWVIELAGFSPTPAEEMGAEFAEESREITTPCYECGNKVSRKLAEQTKKKYRKELCLECRKKADEKFSNTVNDPQFVDRSVEAVRQKKANGGQPVIEMLDKASSVY